MGQVIDFETRGLASLRRRVAEVEEANQDLIAFARGHSGAVKAIHAAVLLALDAEGLDHLIHILTQEWPQVLGLDAVALALVAGGTTGGKAIRADASGLQFVEPRIVSEAAGRIDGVVLRSVRQGHPLFGPASGLIRAEALIRLDAPAPLPTGLLALGQRAPQGLDTRDGSALLLFLGRVVSRMVGRWLLP